LSNKLQENENMYNTDLPNRTELPSSKQLLRSTVIAILVAAVLLVTIVLPAEYGIDPTRIGRTLGLTQMGKTKISQAVWAKREGTAAARTDEMTVVLKPGEGVEIKLEMSKDAKAGYEWIAVGGLVNFNLHGEGVTDNVHSYRKGTQTDRDAGELTALFNGNHGWFWRNRSEGDVTITVKTSGEYWSIKRVV